MDRLVIAGGGTGGHLYPGIAVAREAMRSGCRVVFIGTQAGIEARVLPREGLELRTIKTGKYMGMGIKGKIKTLAGMPAAVSAAAAILRDFRPQAVLGVGGYASFPALAAAGLMGIPVVIQEQNAYPGLTNRTLGRFADKIALGFSEAKRFFDSHKTIFTGNPVRSTLFIADRTKALSEFGMEDGRTTVLVFGGSAGAHTINKGIADALPQLSGMRGRLQFVHQTGERDTEMVEKAYGVHGFRASVIPFIYDMAGAYACADIVICRSGALTLAEVTALGKPAVLIPYPHATNNHQEHNARALERARAAIVIKDSEADGPRLAETITGMVSDRAALSDMSAKSLALGRPDAARAVAEILLKY